MDRCSQERLDCTSGESAVRMLGSLGCGLPPGLGLVTEPSPSCPFPQPRRCAMFVPPVAVCVGRVTGSTLTLFHRWVRHLPCLVQFPRLCSLVLALEPLGCQCVGMLVCGEALESLRCEDRLSSAGESWPQGLCSAVPVPHLPSKPSCPWGSVS